MVEYIDQQICALSWQIVAKTADITATDYCGENIITGSKSNISIWQFIDEPGNYDQLPIAEITSENIPAQVSKNYLIGNIAFTALTNGTVYLHELVVERNNRKSLKLISETNSLHKNYRCNDMLFCAQTNSIITCGNDGAISQFNIEQSKNVDSKKVADSSLKCIDIITPNEVICGTLNGSLKHFDLRSHKCVGTFASQTLSSLICLQRNPDVNHLAIGGNDLGSIIMYDLRNTSLAVAQISAHDSSVSNLRYRPKNSGILYSSSCGGELFRWNLNTELSVNQVPRKVESIGQTGEPLSITSFDINNLGDMLYTTDHGAIFYRKLNEAYL